MREVTIKDASATDQIIVAIARPLAAALASWGYSRNRDDWEEIWRLGAELCAVIRREKADLKVAAQRLDLHKFIFGAAMEAFGSVTEAMPEGRAVPDEKVDTAKDNDGRDNSRNQAASAKKPDTRERLPNRRRSELRDFESLGLRFTMSVSRYSDGRPGELFLDSQKAGSAIDILVRDLAICFSFAVQHGADAEAIRSAVCRDSEGRPLGPLGVALDLLAAPSTGTNP